MEIPDFFKYLSGSQKDMTYSFIVVFPIYFTVMYILVDDFKLLDFHVQALMTSAVSIFSIGFSFILMCIVCVMTNRDLMTVPYLASPSIGAFAYILLSYIFDLECDAHSVFIVHTFFNFAFCFFTVVTLKALVMKKTNKDAAGSDEYCARNSSSSEISDSN